MDSTLPVHLPAIHNRIDWGKEYCCRLVVSDTSVVESTYLRQFVQKRCQSGAVHRLPAELLRGALRHDEVHRCLHTDPVSIAVVVVTTRGREGERGGERGREGERQEESGRVGGERH